MVTFAGQAQTNQQQRGAHMSADRHDPGSFDISQTPIMFISADRLRASKYLGTDHRSHVAADDRTCRPPQIACAIP